MDRYIVVTLGPIFDTINAATSPAALWVGSYLFSYLNKTLCRLLTQRGVAEADILTPYYTAGEEFAGHQGVGLYHDRIVFRPGDFSISDFPALRDEAIFHVAESFQLDYDFLRSYLLVRAAETEAENPILDTGSLLDCLELAKPIVSDLQNNPLHNWLMRRNDVIRSLPLTRNIPNWQLRKSDDQLKSIGDICGIYWNTGLNKHRHFAIVRADGDHMGQLLGRSDNDSIRDFSRRCISYCAGIADLVHNFGGVAIYAGGDDLLAIMPCENQAGETVFDFVKSANDLFARCFSREGSDLAASLSFGITICHYKTPLYIALEDSQRMLFRLAKSKRGCTAVHLQKHSEQAECLIIPHTALDAFIEYYRLLVRDGESIDAARSKLSLFRSMFLTADRNLTAITNLFTNIFESRFFADNDLLHETFPRFYHEILTVSGIESLVFDSDDDLELRNHGIDTFCCILQLIALFTERGGTEE